MLKKFFNYFVVMTMFFGVAVVSSCNKDNDDDDKNSPSKKGDTTEVKGDTTELKDPEIVVTPIYDEEGVEVEAGKVYEVMNPNLEGGKMLIFVDEVSGKANSKEVRFYLVDGSEFALSDKGESYFVLSDKGFVEMDQSEALSKVNAPKVIFYLKYNTDKYEIVNPKTVEKLANAGATETKFAEVDVEFPNFGDDDNWWEELPQRISVVGNGTYRVIREDGKNLIFTVLDAHGAQGEKVVRFEIDGNEYELSDQGASSFGIMDGKYSEMKMADARDNAQNVLFCLSFQAFDYVIMSPTENNILLNNGALPSYFEGMK